MSEFAIYVSAVAGRIASRPGSPFSYIGARLTTPGERKADEEAGKEPVPAVWDEKQIIAVTHREYRANPLAWMRLIRNGDLKERTAQDFKAYTDALSASEKKRDETLAEEAKKAEETKKAEEIRRKAEADEKGTKGGTGGKG